MDKILKWIFITFAINDKESFKTLKEKVERIKKNNKDKLPIIIVGINVIQQIKEKFQQKKG